MWKDYGNSMLIKCLKINVWKVDDFFLKWFLSLLYKNVEFKRYCVFVCLF